MSNRKRPTKLDQVTDLEITLSVVLAEKRSCLEDLLDLRPGTVLEFFRRHDAPLDFSVGGSRLGQGRAIDLGERLGFLVEEVEARSADVALPPSAS